MVVWPSVVTHGHPWSAMVIHGYQWLSMVTMVVSGCTTAAIQIKGTAQWLYCVNLEYLPGQQIV